VKVGDELAVCCCRMSHVRAIQWLCDNVDDDCDDDDDDDDDVTMAGKVSVMPAVTSSTPASHNAISPVGFLFSVNC